MQRVNMDLPKELWKKVSIQSAIEGIQKREVVIKALKQYLNKIKNN
jgi:metal-responsive CopG/Arc/MetJ family transcriptional regulator